MTDPTTGHNGAPTPEELAGHAVGWIAVMRQGKPPLAEHIDAARKTLTALVMSDVHNVHEETREKLAAALRAAGGRYGEALEADAEEPTEDMDESEDDVPTAEAEPTEPPSYWPAWDGPDENARDATLAELVLRTARDSEGAADLVNDTAAGRHIAPDIADRSAGLIVGQLRTAATVLRMLLHWPLSQGSAGAKPVERAPEQHPSNLDATVSFLAALESVRAAAIESERKLRAEHQAELTALQAEAERAAAEAEDERDDARADLENEKAANRRLATRAETAERAAKKLRGDLALAQRAKYQARDGELAASSRTLIDVAKRLGMYAPGYDGMEPTELATLVGNLVDNAHRSVVQLNDVVKILKSAYTRGQLGRPPENPAQMAQGATDRLIRALDREGRLQAELEELEGDNRRANALGEENLKLNEELATERARALKLAGDLTVSGEARQSALALADAARKAKDEAEAELATLRAAGRDAAVVFQRMTQRWSPEHETHQALATLRRALGMGD